ncbi:MAG: hypothetical protein ABJB74_03290 [Gemmatimonas sp.]
MPKSVLVGVALLLNGAALTAQPATTRDSAGIKIISARARSSAPVVFKLADKPTLSVGGLENDPNVEFNHRQGYLRAARLSNGGLAAIDEVRLHYFDASSKRLGVFGHKGAGPNEFQYVMSICATRGDSIVVGDSRNARVTVLDGKGKFAGSFPEESWGSPVLNSCFSDGTFILQKSLAVSYTDPRKYRVTRMRLNGTVSNEIGEFTTAPFDMVTQRETGFIAAGERLYFAEAVESEIRVYDMLGKLREILRTNDPLLPITTADAESKMAATIPNNVSATERSERMARMRGQAFPKSWPAYSRVHVTPSGQIWIEDYRTKYPAPDGWTAYESNGTLIGRLVFSAGTATKRPPEVISFGNGDVLVRTHDDDGASHLEVYALVRTSK